MPQKGHRRVGVSSSVFASTVVVLLIIAGAGYGLYFTMPITLTRTTVTTSTVPAAQASNAQIVTELAYAHWAAIGEGNLTATLSQYSANAVLWWYVRGSPLNTTSGPYTGGGIAATWSKFFSNTPIPYWTVFNYSIAFTGNTSARVTAVVWYVLGGGKVTLKLPYELDYGHSSGTWGLTGDWWGLPNNPGVVVPAVYSFASASTTTSISTTSAATTTTTTSSSGY